MTKEIKDLIKEIEQAGHSKYMTVHNINYQQVDELDPDCLRLSSHS